MPENKFRKDMFKAKRKTPEEIWQGETLGIAEIARFSPSACNTQPWKVENSGEIITVYSYKDPKKHGIMTGDKVRYYNRIDTGIFLLILEICLNHEGIDYERKQYSDNSDDTAQKTLIAEYRLKGKQ